ncbi:MAG: hypothetical protein AAGA70_09510 [Pseudomonadota bacterium]
MSALLRGLICGLLVAAQAGLAQAQDRVEPILALLSALPMPQGTGQMTEIAFGDPAAMRDLAAGLGPEQAGFLALARTIPVEFAQSAAMQAMAPGPSGALDFGQVDRIATIRRAQAFASVMEAPGHADTIGPALVAQFGYLIDDRLGVQVWARGADDTRDPASRGDPFSGNTGQPARLALRAGFLVHGSSWALMDQALTGGAMVADDPTVVALLESLQGSGAPDGVLAAVRIYMGDGSDLTAPALLVADLTDGVADTGLLAFIAPADQAAEMAETIQMRWGSDGPEHFDGSWATLFDAETPVVRVVETSALSVVSVAAAGRHRPDTPPWQNRRASRFDELYLNGGLAALWQ